MRAHSRLLALLLFAGGAATAYAAAPAPTLHAPPHAGSSSLVVIRGSGWGKPGCSSAVHLRAYIWGVSPYPAADVAPATVDASGSFVRNWKTPKVQERLAWTVRAERRCGSASLVRYATVVVG